MRCKGMRIKCNRPDSLAKSQMLIVSIDSVHLPAAESKPFRRGLLGYVSQGDLLGGLR